MKVTCPHCLQEITFNPLVLERRLSSTLVCPSCKSEFPKPEIFKKRGKNNARKRSNKQEKKVAKQYGAKVQPGSGSMAHAKADVILEGTYRIECKHTVKESISLKRAWLKKLSEEARAGELAILEIEFQGVSPPEQYAVIRSQDLRDLLFLKEHRGLLDED